MDGFVPAPDIDIDRLLTRAAQFLDAGRLGAARPLLAAIERLAPPSQRSAALSVALAVKEGRLEDAREMLDGAIAEWPGCAPLRLSRADVRRQLGDMVGAADEAAQAVLLDPRDANAKAVLGVSLLALNQAADARTCLAEALKAAPANTLFRLALSDAQSADGDPDAAAATLAEGIEAAPQERALHNAAVLLAVQRGRFLDAIALAEAARQLGVADTCLFGLAGHALSSLSRHAEATELYAEALKLGPPDPYVRHLVMAAGALPPADRAAPEYVRALFNGYAPRFEQHLLSLGYRIPGLIRKSLLQFTTLGTGHALGPVLDLGCGTGLMAVTLLDLPAGPITGVDLSPKMLAEASPKNLYAELHQADLLEFLAADTRSWAAIIAADVCCYIGALGPVLTAIRPRLGRDGVFIFSVELRDPDSVDPRRGWQLGPEGRYAHSLDYIRAESVGAGFQVLAIAEETLRNDNGVPVPGLIVTLTP